MPHSTIWESLLLTMTVTWSACCICEKTHTKFLWKNAHTPYKLTWVLYIMYSYSEHKYKTYCFIIPTVWMTNYRSDQIINQSVRQMVKWLFKCLPYCFFFFNTAKTFSRPFVSQYNKLAKLNWNKYFVCVLGAVCCWSEVSWAEQCYELLRVTVV